MEDNKTKCSCCGYEFDLKDEVIKESYSEYFDTWSRLKDRKNFKFCSHECIEGYIDELIY